MSERCFIKITQADERRGVHLLFCGQAPKQNIAGSPAYCIRKVKQNTGLATPARKNEIVARVESLTLKQLEG